MGKGRYREARRGKGLPPEAGVPVGGDFAAREREKARELRQSQWWKNQIASGVCHYCGRTFKPSELTMDHVIPVARGGRSERGNVVPCCKECNTAKKSKTQAERILDSLDIPDDQPTNSLTHHFTTSPLHYFTTPPLHHSTNPPTHQLTMTKIFDTDRRIRLGIWGLGRGQNFIHSAKFLNIDVVAGCDINPEMRASFAKNAPDAFLTADEDEFLAQDFDAVLVATYFPAHARHAIKALEHGKHVMCEVTAFRSPAEGVRLVEAVERSGKVYNLLENYPFMKENMYLKQLWDEGFFGEFLYGEYEYVHCSRQLSYAYNFRVDGKQLLVEPGWVVHDWRAGLNGHLYNTHSLGPLMHITGLRPVAVEAFPNTVSNPGTLISPVGKTCKSSAASLVRMSNGGVMRNLMGSTTMDNHIGGRLWGTKAGADKMTRGHLRLCIGADGEGLVTEVVPEWPEIGQLAEQAGHGGGDFWELYYFAREILTGEKAPWNVYSAADVTITGILAARSAARGGEPQRVPDFRDKADRDAYREDWAEDVPVFDPKSVFPPDADKELVKDFNRVMVELYHNQGAQRQLYTYIQGRRLYGNLIDPEAKRKIVNVARGLPALLPRMAELCRLAQRMRDAYPDSIGGKTLDCALAHLPLDMVYNYEKTSAEIADWLAQVDAPPAFGELSTRGNQN